MIIALTDNEPIKVQVDYTNYNVRSVGSDEKRCYIGADDGNIVIPISIFFSGMPALRNAWFHGFRVVNEPTAAQIVRSLLAQGKAAANADRK